MSTVCCFLALLALAFMFARYRALRRDVRWLLEQQAADRDLPGCLARRHFTDVLLPGVVRHHDPFGLLVLRLPPLPPRELLEAERALSATIRPLVRRGELCHSSDGELTVVLRGRDPARSMKRIVVELQRAPLEQMPWAAFEATDSTLYVERQGVYRRAVSRAMRELVVESPMCGRDPVPVLVDEVAATHPYHRIRLGDAPVAQAGVGA